MMTNDQTIKLILDMGNSGASVQEVKLALDALKGHSGLGGQGLLGASYAAQDFISVLSGGGGIGRALGSISNNMPQILAGLGLGAGLAGVMGAVTAGVAAAIPMIEAWWNAVDSEAAERAKEKLKAIKEELKQVAAEFKKLAEMPTTLESEQGKLLTEFLGMRPTAEQAKAGVRGVLGQVPAYAAEAMSPEQAAEATKLRQRIATETTGTAPLRARLAELQQQAVSQYAERLITQATKPGPAGEEARRKLVEFSSRNPGLFPAGFADTLQSLTPEALEAQRGEVAEAEAFGARAKAGGEKRRATEEAEQKRKEIDDRDMEMAVEMKRRDDERAAREKAAAEAALEREAMGAAAPEETARQRRRRQAERQAGGLMAQGPAIVGQAFGPQAAQAAMQATPAEVEAMRAQTVKNLGEGQLPYPALLAAFQEIYQASQREASQRRAFVGQMNGMQGRFQQMGQSAMDR
jgi:uncharacterized phage infection (PIP) family protein YhgE